MITNEPTKIIGFNENALTRLSELKNDDLLEIQSTLRLSPINQLSKCVIDVQQILTKSALANVIKFKLENESYEEEVISLDFTKTEPLTHNKKDYDKKQFLSVRGLSDLNIEELKNMLDEEQIKIRVGTKNHLKDGSLHGGNALSLSVENALEILENYKNNPFLRIKFESLNLSDMKLVS